MLDHFRLHIDFQCQQQGEEEFVFLIQSTTRVFKNVVRQTCDDVGDSFRRDWRLWRSK